MSKCKTSVEVGGMGHSVKRKEDARFIRGQGTYVDDVVEVLFRCLTAAPVGSRILNVGGGNPVELKKLIATIERCLGRTADVELLPMQPGDVPLTAANPDQLKKTLNFVPAVSLEEGILRFVNWFQEYHSDLLVSQDPSDSSFKEVSGSV